MNVIYQPRWAGKHCLKTHSFSLNDSLNSLNLVTENISYYGKRIQTCPLLS